MKFIKCIKCDKTFNRKRELVLHTQRGKNCISIGSVNVPEYKKVLCVHCGREYTAKSSLKRHLENVNSKCYTQV